MSIAAEQAAASMITMECVARWVYNQIFDAVADETAQKVRFLRRTRLSRESALGGLMAVSFMIGTLFSLQTILFTTLHAPVPQIHSQF